MTQLFKTTIQHQTLTVDVKGLGSIVINRTEEGLIVDAYDLSGEVNLNTFARPDEDFSESFVKEVETFLKALYPSVDVDDEEIMQDYALEKRPLESVLTQKKGHPLDLTNLTPVNGSCDDFHTETRKLCRPYFPLTDEQWQELIAAEHDYYKVNNQVFTFGTADGSYALMPLGTEANRNLLF